MKRQTGGFINNTGYLTGAPTAGNPYNIIPGGDITMHGVSFPVWATPIKKGKPKAPVMMMPGTNYKFDADFVHETPALPRIYANPYVGTDDRMQQQFGIQAGYNFKNGNSLGLSYNQGDQFPGIQAKINFQQGGRQPIIVTNPNDPRLKAYNDSLSLYNERTKEAYDLLSKNKDKGFILGASNILPTDKNLGYSNPIESYNIEQIETNWLQPRKYQLSGNWQSPKDLINKSVFNDKNIKPVSYQEVNGTGSSNYFPIYKKPVQPVVYQKPVQNQPPVGQPEQKDYPLANPENYKAHGNIQITSPQQDQLVQPQAPVQQPTNWQFNYPIEGGQGKMAQQYFNSQAEYDTALKQATSANPLMGNANFMGSEQRGDKYSALFRAKPIYGKGGLTEAQYMTQRGLKDAHNHGDFDNITPNQARQILHNKKINGHPLTSEEYKLFGYLSKGNTLKFEEGGNIYQTGGFSKKDLLNFLLEDDKKEEVPTAPTEEQVHPDIQKSQEDTPDSDYELAMQIANSTGDATPESEFTEGNPYSVPTKPSGNPYNSGGFQNFGSYEEGRNALEHQLRLYQTGMTRNPVGPKSTILQAMSVYAPVGDGKNNPLLYAQQIARHLGVSISTPISQINTKSWADVIEKIEGNKSGNNPGNLRSIKR